MLSKTDCILLLSEISDNGVNTTEYMKELLSSNTVSLKILKYINDTRQLDVADFYDRIRKNYNNKKSDLYINIIREIENTEEVILTLSALLTQIILYSKKLEDSQLFLKHARASEISLVLHNYFKNHDISNAIKLIKLIKADIIALEMVSGRRNES